MMTIQALHSINRSCSFCYTRKNDKTNKCFFKVLNNANILLSTLRTQTYILQLIYLQRN